jgi:hypothetical protein
LAVRNCIQNKFLDFSKIFKVLKTIKIRNEPGSRLEKADRPAMPSDLNEEERNIVDKFCICNDDTDGVIYIKSVKTFTYINHISSLVL